MNDGTPKPIPRSRSWTVPILFLCLATCAEPLSTPQVPPGRRLVFPSELQWLPSSQTVLILNTNFDQQFQTGLLSALSLPKLAQVWQEHAGKTERTVGAAPDTLYSLVKIPSLGGQLAWDEQGQFGLIAHRGWGLVTYLEQRPLTTAGVVQIHCGDPESIKDLDKQAQSSDCDAEHLLQLSKQVGAEQGAALEDSFAISIVPTPGSEAKGWAWIGQLTSGWLSQVQLLPGKIGLLQQQDVLPAGTIRLHSQKDSSGKPSMVAVGTSQSGSGQAQIWRWQWDTVTPPPSAIRNQTAILPVEISTSSLHDAVVTNSGEQIYTLSSMPDGLAIWQRREQQRGTDGGPTNIETNYSYVNFVPLPDLGRASRLSHWQADPTQTWLAITSYTQETVWVMRCQQQDCAVWSRHDFAVGHGPYGAVFVPNPLLPAEQGDSSPWLLLSLFDSNELFLMDVVGHRSQGHLATMMVQDK